MPTKMAAKAVVNSEEMDSRPIRSIFSPLPTVNECSPTNTEIDEAATQPIASSPPNEPVAKTGPRTRSQKTQCSLRGRIVRTQNPRKKAKKPSVSQSNSPENESLASNENESLSLDPLTDKLRSDPVPDPSTICIKTEPGITSSSLCSLIDIPFSDDVTFITPTKLSDKRDSILSAETHNPIAESLNQSTSTASTQNTTNPDVLIKIQSPHSQKKPLSVLLSTELFANGNIVGIGLQNGEVIITQNCASKASTKPPRQREERRRKLRRSRQTQRRYRSSRDCEPDYSSSLYSSCYSCFSDSSSESYSSDDDCCRHRYHKYKSRR